MWGGITVLQVLVAAWLPFLFLQQGAETQVAAIVSAVFITVFLVFARYMPVISRDYYTTLAAASLFILGIVGFIVSSLWSILVLGCVAALMQLVTSMVQVKIPVTFATGLAFLVMAWSTTLSGILPQQPVSSILFLVLPFLFCVL